MKIEVVLFFLVPGACFCDETDFCRETTSSIWYDHALIGHVIKSLLTRGIFACAHKCLSVPRCSSYNYETSAQGHGVCELNDGSESKHPNITEKHGFAFSQVQRKIKSCLEAWQNGARVSGFYCIQDNDGHSHKMYCDLASEPGWVWTLVMSMTLGNRNEQFAQKGFLADSPRNAEIPNWQTYRLPLTRMMELRSHSSHWRVTCSFPTFGVDYRDYARAKFEEFELLSFRANRRCKLMEYMDVRGHACHQCTAAWAQDKNDFLTHRSDVNYGCTRRQTPKHVNGEQTFGRYKKGRNPKFRCTSGDSAVTSYWFGSRFKKKS